MTSIPPGAGTTPARGAALIRTRLTLPATFNFDWIRTFLTLRRVASLERWTDDNAYIRSVCIDSAPALLTIRYVYEPDGLNAVRSAVSTRNEGFFDNIASASSSIEVPRNQAAASEARRRKAIKRQDAGSKPSVESAGAWLDVSFAAAPALTLDAVRAAVGRMFDLDGDLEAFIAHVRRDKLLGPLVKRRPHVRLPRLIDPFEGLVRAMLGQQVTVRAASTMTDRLTRRFGTPLADGDDDALYAFPRPDVIAAVGPDALRTIGLTRAKAAAIARLAETLASGRLDCAQLANLPSDDVQAALVALPGIGPWTASYVRMRVLGDRDAFPAADLGVIKALEAFGIPRADQAATAERWRPWRAYAVVHLWESLGD